MSNPESRLPNPESRFPNPVDEQSIRDLVARVRRRWRTIAAAQAILRASLAGALIVFAAVVVTQWTGRAAAPLVLTWTAALVAAIVAAIWGLEPLRHLPSDTRVARFIEERTPTLEDRLATAVDVVTSGRSRADAGASLARPMVADAAMRVRHVDIDTIVRSAGVRRAGLQAAAGAAALLLALIAARGPVRRTLDAVALMLFPDHVDLRVSPGDVRVEASTPLTIEALLVGNRAPIRPRVEIAAGEAWRQAAMNEAAGGGFSLALQSVTAGFTYRVVAGPITSRAYAVTVVHPPRVARIDVDYRYPAALGLKPRTEVDSGDIYAPAGTEVRLHVHTDRPASTARMRLADGRVTPLAAEASDHFSATLKVVEDTSYRVALWDREGLSTSGDTEYFIRTLEDRPPEVHIVKPASDRAVTPLEEVDVEAQADDDYGIERLDLVYSVRGGEEKVLPFDIPARASSVTGRRTLYLEDLGVQPGDFVAYYARARDVTRTRRSSEARSDIFFLEVKPFEQEFALAQSQSMAGSGYSGSIDDLVNAQKQVVVATWKLDRRAKSANGSRSEQDIRAVSRTEADLRSRVDQTSSSFRESTMRDPRHRTPQGGRGGSSPEPLRAGETLPEEDSMAAAAAAMGRAITSLDALKTGDAMPSEMEALNDLLKAQAQVKRRQVTRQQAGAGGPGNNNRNYDISTLFDKELQRTQQTNYETPTSAEQKGDSTLDKIRDLARRQDELMRRQQQLANDKSGSEDLKRELDKLTREQMELRQRAEELARQLSSERANGQTGQTGQAGQSGGNNGTSDSRQAARGTQGGQQSQQLHGVAEEMQAAAGELRRQDAGRASERGARALEKLRDIERDAQARGPKAPDERRRALGDMQVETRQLADAQRDVASQLDRVGRDDQSADALRRLAGEEDRLTERARRLEAGLNQAAAGEVARDLGQQKIADRMQKSAEAIRNSAADGANPQKTGAARSQADAQREMARALDSTAARLAAATGGRGGDAGKTSEQLARAQTLRERMNALGREMDKLDQSAGQPPAGGQASNGRSGAKTASGDDGRSGRGQSGEGGAGGDELTRLRQEYARHLKETSDLIDELRREDPTFARGGVGFTFEGQGMTLSAPGTEAFKQDFSRWEELRRQATTALDQAESSLSARLQAQQLKDRLAAGVEDKAPADYQKQVDSYFKAIASKKKP